MNIKKKLETGEYTINEIVEWLDTKNPTILYSLTSTIIQNDIKDPLVIKKLYTLANKLSDQDVILGFYKIGHLSMSTLLKLGVNYSDIFKPELDSFDKDMTLRFYQDNNF